MKNKILCLLLSLLAYQDLYAAECKERYEVSFIPFETSPYQPVTVESFKNGWCQFKSSDCEVAFFFDEQKLVEKKSGSEPRIKILDSMTRKEVFITTSEELLRENKTFDIPAEIRLNQIKKLRETGTKCAAKNKFNKICAGKKTKSDLCKRLEKGEWPK